MVSALRLAPLRTFVLACAVGGASLPGQAQARFWTIPGTAGRSYELVAWDQTQTDTPIVALTSGGELVRIDPVSGVHTTVARPVPEAGQDDRIGQIVADRGMIDFTNGSRNRVERIEADGQASVLAGGGAGHPSRVPARADSVGFTPLGIALGPDGARFISGQNADGIYILLLTPSPGRPGQGAIRIIAGGGAENHPDVLLDARDARLEAISQLAPVRNGGVAFHGLRCLRELAPYVDGLGEARWQLVTTAGRSPWMSELVVDAANATHAILFPEGIASGPDGARYVNERSKARVRKLIPNEDGQTLACATLIGTGKPGRGPGPDGTPCRDMAIVEPRGLAGVPGGGVLMATWHGLQYLGPDAATDDHLGALVQYAVLAARHYDRRAFESITTSLRRQTSPETQGFASLTTSLRCRVPDDLVEHVASFLPFNPVTAMRAQMALQEILRQVGPLPGFAAKPPLAGEEALAIQD